MVELLAGLVDCMHGLVAVAAEIVLGVFQLRARVAQLPQGVMEMSIRMGLHRSPVCTKPSTDQPAKSQPAIRMMYPSLVQIKEMVCNARTGDRQIVLL